MTGSMQVQFLKSFKDRKLASLKDRLARWVSLHPMCINFFGEDPCGFGLFADQSFLLEGSSTVHLLVSNGVYRKGELHSEHSNIKNVNKPNCSHIMQNNYLLASCTKTVLQTPLCFFHGFPHAWGHRGLGNSDPHFRRMPKLWVSWFFGEAKLGTARICREPTGNIWMFILLLYNTSCGQKDIYVIC